MQDACGVAAVGLVVLKLTGLVTWSRWWVLSPLWLSGFLMTVVLCALLVLLVLNLRGRAGGPRWARGLPRRRLAVLRSLSLAVAVGARSWWRWRHRDQRQVNLERQAGYVMTVKASMPALHRQLKKLPRARIPAASPRSKDHGRRARRTIKAASAPSWTEFSGPAQAAQLRRTVTPPPVRVVDRWRLSWPARWGRQGLAASRVTFPQAWPRVSSVLRRPGLRDCRTR